MRDAIGTWVVVGALSGLLSPPVHSQVPKKTPSGTASQRPIRSSRGAVTPTATFESLAAQASAAREANDLEKAIPLYEQAVKLKQTWSEGYWYLGTSNYELDRFEASREAFRRVTRLTPDNANAWAFQGLCDYQLKSYEDALSALVRARTLGVSPKQELAGIVRYHAAILLNRIEDFEQALDVLREFARDGNDGPRVIEAFGIATLRMPLLPTDVPGSKREIVMLAGRASYFAAARLYAAGQKAFEELVSRYPDTPHVHYAFGVFLTAEQPDKAIEQYLEELKISPRHPWAKMQLAFEYIKRQDMEKARPFAQQAVEEAPNVFVAHRALGQVLLETGDVEGAVREYRGRSRTGPRESVHALRAGARVSASRPDRGCGSGTEGIYTSRPVAPRTTQRRAIRRRDRTRFAVDTTSHATVRTSREEPC